MPNKLPIEPLTPDEAAKLLAQPNKNCATGLRSYALLTTLYRGGLRCNESLDLYPKDVDLDNGEVTVLHGKGDKRRVVGIDQAACNVIARWMDKRSALGMNGRHRIFCTLKGGRVKDSYVRQMVKRMAERAGIEKRVHPHCLRHTMAVEMLAEGIDLRAIQAHLGHSSLSVTARYLNHLKPEHAIAAVRNRSWESGQTARGNANDDRAMLDTGNLGNLAVLALLAGWLGGAQSEASASNRRR